MIIVYLLISYVVFAPLIGIFMLYHGWYSISAGTQGYDNGAFGIYLVHSIFLIMGIIWGFKILPISNKNRELIPEKNIWLLRRILKKGFLIIFMLLLIMLFLFQGYKVILGEFDKGTFRSETIGAFGLGFLAYYIIKYIIPSVLVYMVYNYKRYDEKYFKIKNSKFYLISSLLMSSLIGLSWGFKSSAIVVLLPALIVYYLNKKVKLFSLIGLSMFFFLVIYISAYLFDKENLYNISLIEFIFIRLTVIEGDTFWKVYDLIKNKEIFPFGFDYFNFLLYSFGNKILSIFSSSTPEEIIKYNYSAFLTYIVSGDIFHATSGKHNLTGTIASEGLIFLGFPLMYIFSFLAGVFSGINIKLIKVFYYAHKPKLLALSTTYFVFVTWSWLKSGGLVTLLHISNLPGLFISYFILILIEKKIVVHTRV